MPSSRVKYSLAELQIAWYSNRDGSVDEVTFCMCLASSKRAEDALASLTTAWAQRFNASTPPSAVRSTTASLTRTSFLLGFLRKKGRFDQRKLA